jgi:hypothetical protein
MSRSAWLLPLKIEDRTIVSNAKAIGAEFGLFQGFGMGQRIMFVSQEGFLDTLPHIRIERVNIPDGAVCIDQPILHRPNTSA